MKKQSILTLLLCAGMLCPIGAYAQTAQSDRKLPQPAAPAQSDQEPVRIDADQALEWRRDDKKYVAVGNVVVTQGAYTLKADRVTADYREGEGGKGTAIYQLTAHGNVVITSSDGDRATAKNAVYTLDDKKAVLTGDAVVVREKNTITADQITAWFGPDAATKKTVMVRSEAVGHVVMTSPEEKATGSKAVYERAKDTARLDGPVVLTRGKNILNGTWAEVNLKTNISTIHGDQSKPGRVTGIFYPEEKKSK